MSWAIQVSLSSWRSDKRHSVESMTLKCLLGLGKFQIHKRASDGAVDAMDDGTCLAKKSCKDADNTKAQDLKLAKCSHCGAKTWNILGDANAGYVVTSTEESGSKVCIKREGSKATTVPCTLEEASEYTALMLQFASASDITSMSSPGARLVTAASDGDKKAIQAMLKEGVDINFRDWDQLTALLPVASTGNLDLAKFLVKEGIDVNAGDKDGITALMEASIMGHVKLVEFLIESGAVIDQTSSSGVTALWLAASQGKSDCMKLLLAKGADASVSRSDGITALMTASVGGHLEAVRLLLEAGADPAATDNDGVTPLMNAAEGGSLEVVKLLAEAAKEDAGYLDTWSETGFTAMIIAAAQGNSKVVEYLLEAGADPNAVHENGVTALMYAASNNYVDVLELLLKTGNVEIDAKHTNGGTALLEATTAGAADATRVLIEKGAAFDLQDNDGVTPLMAVGSQTKKEAHAAVLDALKAKYSGQALIDHINLFSYSGGSAVMFAAAAGNADLVKDLIDLGADIKAIARATPDYLEKLEKSVEEGTYQGDEPHVDGLTALSVAAQGGHLKTVEVLLESGVDVNIADDEGRTPLTLAIKGNYGEVSTMLISAGADPNTSFTDDKGQEHNLLFDAIMVENEMFAKVLIEKGADIYYKDEKGVTTLLQACHRGLVDIAQMLVDKHKASGKAGFIDDASDEGISPLIAASSEGHLTVVKLLIEAKADMNVKDKDDTSALMAASARGHLDVVKELLKAGANINDQNRDGHTALMFAYNGKNQVETLWERFNQFSTEADSGADDGGTGPLIREALESHAALVDLLLESGADPKLKDKEGHVAKDFDYHPDTDAELLEKETKAEAARDESRNEL